MHNLQPRYWRRRHNHLHGWAGEHDRRSYGKSNTTVDNLNAPTSGAYAGLLMVQDTVAGATYTTSAKFDGNAGQTLNGLVYMPNSSLNFQGDPSITNSCLLVVAQTLNLDGNSSLATGGCPNTFPLPEVKKIALAS
jgi:hypothetical protein